MRISDPCGEVPVRGMGGPGPEYQDGHLKVHLGGYPAKYLDEQIP